MCALFLCVSLYTLHCDFGPKRALSSSSLPDSQSPQKDLFAYSKGIRVDTYWEETVDSPIESGFVPHLFTSKLTPPNSLTVFYP